jgi:hypothetical protein
MPKRQKPLKQQTSVPKDSSVSITKPDRLATIGTWVGLLGGLAGLASFFFAYATYSADQARVHVGLSIAPGIYKPGESANDARFIKRREDFGGPPFLATVNITNLGRRAVHIDQVNALLSNQTVITRTVDAVLTEEHRRVDVTLDLSDDVQAGSDLAAVWVVDDASQSYAIYRDAAWSSTLWKHDGFRRPFRARAIHAVRNLWPW